MKKAYVHFPTLFFILALTLIPNINAIGRPGPKVGKIIKANQFPGGEYKIQTVVIDPGHGGHDPGCRGASVKEKHIALAIGKYLAQALKNNYPSLNVIMTRSTDKFIPLNERALIATQHKADLFISIHCNSILNASGTMGAETYVLGLHATETNLEVAKRENASILLEDNYQETYGFDPNSNEAHIVLSMFQNAFLEQSILFAEKVQNRLYTEAGRKNRGVKQAGFIVLKYATMPSVLVEAGFLSNRKEEDYLSTEEGQKEVANSILLAFADYKKEIEAGDESFIAGDSPVRLETNSHKINSSAPEAERPINNKVSMNESNDLRVVPVKQELKQEFINVPPKNTTSTSAGASNETSKIIPSTPVSEPRTTITSGKTQNTDIQYRVQLAASPKLLDVTVGKWSKVEYLLEVVQEDRLYKYQVRNFASLDEATEAKLKLRSVGFNDAFVVAYQNGVRVKP